MLGRRGSRGGGGGDVRNVVHFVKIYRCADSLKILEACTMAKYSNTSTIAEGYLRMCHSRAVVT